MSVLPLPWAAATAEESDRVAPETPRIAGDGQVRAERVRLRAQPNVSPSVPPPGPVTAKALPSTVSLLP